MRCPRIVIDTCVLVSALRSNRGASFKLIELIGSGKFQASVSVPLILEYEDATRRPEHGARLDQNQIDAVLDYVCEVSDQREIFYLWRPLLKDPKDDLVLELAVESSTDYIVTFNLSDFAGAERFGIDVITPQQFLKKIGAIK